MPKQNRSLAMQQHSTTPPPIDINIILGLSTSISSLPNKITCTVWLILQNFENVIYYNWIFQIYYKRNVPKGKARLYLEELFFPKKWGQLFACQSSQTKISTKLFSLLCPSSCSYYLCTDRRDNSWAWHMLAVLLFVREKHFTASRRSRFKSPSAENQAA